MSEVGKIDGPLPCLNTSDLLGVVAESIKVEAEKLNVIDIIEDLPFNIDDWSADYQTVDGNYVNKDNVEEYTLEREGRITALDALVLAKDEEAEYLDRAIGLFCLNGICIRKDCPSYNS